MRVKMLTIESGPGGSFHPGDEREVSDHHGRMLLAGRHAVDMAAKARVTSTLFPQESAVLPEPTKRKSGKVR